ncbi:hypothetical protein IWX49DRAFT_559587 [Phyllosticta citricarpa]
MSSIPVSLLHFLCAVELHRCQLCIVVFGINVLCFSSLLALDPLSSSSCRPGIPAGCIGCVSLITLVLPTMVSV